MARKNKENPLFNRPLGEIIKEAEEKREEEKYKEGKEFGELLRRGLGEAPQRAREAEKKLEAIKKAEKKRKEKELGVEREKAAGVFEEKVEPSLEEYVGQKVSEVVEKKREELDKKIREERTLGGEELPVEEIQRATRDFYLQELGYSIQYKSQRGNWLSKKTKDLLRLRETVLDKEGNLVVDETGKPVEFKTAWNPRGETPLIRFLKQEFVEKTKKDLEKEGRGKGLKEEIKEITLEDYVEENLPERLKKEEEELRKAVETRKTGKEKTKEKFTARDINVAIHNYHLKALGYSREMRAGTLPFQFPSERFVNKKGEYVIDEKTGKPVEVKGLKKANEFLKGKLEEKMRKDLEKEGREKGLN